MASHPKFSRFATVLEVDPRTKAEVAPENAWEVSDDTTISRHWKRWLLVEHVVDQEPKRHPFPNVEAYAGIHEHHGTITVVLIKVVFVVIDNIKLGQQRPPRNDQG